MSLKELMKNDDDKYIGVGEFIKLVASHTNDSPDVVIEYLTKYSHTKGFDIDIYLKGFLNEYSGEWLLSELLIKDSQGDFRPHTLSELESDEDCVRAYFLRKDIFNIQYIKKLNISELPKQQGLGEHQKLLITCELFTPKQIACLLTDCNPAYQHNNDDYNARLDMVSNAIDAGKLNYVNSKDEISAEQIKIWLKDNKIIFDGFNDNSSLEQPINVNELQKRIDELENQLSKFQTAAPDVVNIPFGKRIDLTNKKLPPDERLKESYQIYSNDFSFHEDTHPVNTPDEMIKRIQGLLNVIKKKDNKIFELEQQTNTPANAQAEIDKLKEQLDKANTELAAAKTMTIDQPLDWQNMSEHVYPPELHLALMIWQRIYVDNELKDSHITSHGGKFKVIAKRLGLNPDNTLGKRVAMLINTAHSKNKQDELADPLRAIEQLYMPPKKEKTTS